MVRRSAMLCALACGAVFAADDSNTAGTIPLDHFTRHDAFGTVKISPDGQFLALSTGKYGRSAVAFWDLKNKGVASGVRAPERLEIDDFYWVSPTRVWFSLH